jgi:hypothetical protein
MDDALIQFATEESVMRQPARRALRSALYTCGLLESPALRYSFMHVCGLYRHRSLD